MKTLNAPAIRWMRHEDLDAVCALSAECFDDPWDRRYWLNATQQKKCRVLVAEWDGSVAGVMAYQALGDAFHIATLAVAFAFRSKGVGRSLVGRLTGQLTPDTWRRCTAVVNEYMTPAQFFFKAMGFRAVEFIRHRDGNVILFRRMFCD